MAITIDFATLTIKVPQSDLTLISGTLYSLDTETKFRADVNALMDDEEGIVFENPIEHFTQYTVVGETFARKIEIINSYKVEFTPDSQFSVKLTGSNNNLFDVEAGVLTQNQVQVIPTNSGGLIDNTTAFLAAFFTRVMEGTETFEQAMRLIRANAAGKITRIGKIHRVRDAADSKDRIVATADEKKRDVTSTDGT